MRRSWGARFVTLVLLALVAGCATRVVPPLPVALAYPEFVYPTLPQPLETADAARRIDSGWRFLQNNDLDSAGRKFAAAGAANPCAVSRRCGWRLRGAGAPRLRSRAPHIRRRASCGTRVCAGARGPRADTARPQQERRRPRGVRGGRDR